MADKLGPSVFQTCTKQNKQKAPAKTSITCVLCACADGLCCCLAAEVACGVQTAEVQPAPTPSWWLQANTDGCPTCRAACSSAVRLLLLSTYGCPAAAAAASPPASMSTAAAAAAAVVPSAVVAASGDCAAATGARGVLAAPFATAVPADARAGEGVMWLAGFMFCRHGLSYSPTLLWPSAGPPPPLLLFRRGRDCCRCLCLSLLLLLPGWWWLQAGGDAEALSPRRWAGDADRQLADRTGPSPPQLLRRGLLPRA